MFGSSLSEPIISINETITYVLAGSVEHLDSLGNRGVMPPGDLQRMTAGRGIIHQEMPEGDPNGQLHGFQLWANLPSSFKMTAPRYEETQSAPIPEVTDNSGALVRIFCGNFWGQTGPVEGVAADPSYLDITLFPGVTRTLPVSVDQHAFAYVFDGSGFFHKASASRGVLTENRHLVLFDQGDEVTVTAGDNGMRFLLASGRPLVNRWPGTGPS